MEGSLNNAPLSPPSPFPEVPSAPPPPPEVQVRTMRSDLESMAKSGGGSPRFRIVKAAGLAMENNSVSRAVRAKKEKALIIALVAVAVAAVVACIGYFAYPAFFSGSTAPQQPPQQPTQSGASAGASAAQPNAATTTATTTVTSVATSTPAATASSAQNSSFKEPADQVLTLVLSAGGTVTSAADLQTFNQRLSALLTAADKKSNFIEIDAKGADGRDLGIAEILSQANAEIISPTLLAANFDPAAAFFVYRDKNGFWPGYVLSLQTGKSWLFLENDVAKLETSPNIANLFLYDIGVLPTSGFVGGTVANTSVRVLPFPSANPSASFVYGWYGGTRLIVSTSLAGFAQAVSHL